MIVKQPEFLKRAQAVCFYTSMYPSSYTVKDRYFIIVFKLLQCIDLGFSVQKSIIFYAVR